jgi:hypothetical protein
MIAKYNRISLCLGIPGLILQNVGFIAVINYTSTVSPTEATPPHILFMQLMCIVGTVLLLIGLAYYAIAKGQSAIWCLSAFLGIIGLFILSRLKDKCPTIDDPTTDIEVNAKRKRSRLAISSLILSIFGLFSFGLTAILGLVIGILAIIKIKHSKGSLTGQGMAIIGIVISSVIVCIFGYMIFIAATA